VTRRERQGEILRLVQEREISTQAELAHALAEAGGAVVQTTISRDITELGLVKVRAASGRLVYAVPGTALDRDRERELRGALRRWALSFEPSGNLVVVQTPNGFSNALAQVIDESRHPRIAGTIAGENTILVVARERTTGAQLCDELHGYLMEGAA
jgi:transcriptional regulator of arginine metabolism